MQFYSIFICCVWWDDKERWNENEKRRYRVDNNGKHSWKSKKLNVSIAIYKQPSVWKPFRGMYAMCAILTHWRKIACILKTFSLRCKIITAGNSLMCSSIRWAFPLRSLDFCEMAMEEIKSNCHQWNSVLTFFIPFVKWRKVFAMKKRSDRDESGGDREYYIQSIQSWVAIFIFLPFFLCGNAISFALLCLLSDEKVVRNIFTSKCVERVHHSTKCEENGKFF